MIDDIINIKEIKEASHNKGIPYEKSTAHEPSSN